MSMAAQRGSRVKIRAPRKLKGLLNANNDVDFEDAWKSLEAALFAMHNKNAATLSFEEIYRHAYKIVLKRKAETFYERLQKFEKDWLVNKVHTDLESLVVPSLLGQNQLASAAGTESERRSASERFLKGCKDFWDDHQLVMNMATDVFMYLDRVNRNDQNRPSIYSSGMAQFKDHVLLGAAQSQPTPVTNGATPTAASPVMIDLVKSMILDQIALERDGDLIDKSLIKGCVYMLEGLYETTDEQEDERLYLTRFEHDFLDASRTFYRNEGDRLLAQVDAATYCKHAVKRIKEEGDRCKSTLSQSTTQRIITVVEDELVRTRIRQLITMESGVKHMIDANRFDDLQLVYDLNSRVDDQKKELVLELQRRVLEIGSSINEAALSPPTANIQQDKEADRSNVNHQTAAAILWVESILALKDKYDQLWKMSFDSDVVIQPALTKSFTESINAFPRCSEVVSLFIDENMKKGIKDKTEKEVDEVLEKAIVLLRYIQDKDMFERYYKKHLCKRLLMQKSVSTDVEKQMVSRMKIELGNSFTSKLENMFKDMSVSHELTIGYKARSQGSESRVELAINVLTTMVWPLETMTSSSEDDHKLRCIFPPELDRIKKGFENFYSSKHSGRQLNWMANLGSADIRAVFPKLPGKEGRLGKERRHELNVSTYAMVVLMLFNDLPDNASLTFDEIQERTNISEGELKRNLQALAVAPKTRVLLKEPMSRDVKRTDRFSFNESFQSQFLKIKVGVVAAGNKVEGDRERLETEKKNNEARGYAVDAAVVRIMKQRKELSHANLMAETMSQLAGQFRPDVNVIKTQIERLIEREYLERIDEAMPPAYRYLA